MNRRDNAVTVHGAASAPRSSEAPADLESIRASSHGAGTNGDGRPEATCRHQAMVIDTLGEALSSFERGARAFKAENCALRAENDRLRRHRHVPSRPGGGLESGEPAKAAIPIGAQAPSVARSVVAQWLAGQVAPSLLETALLLVSELVSNGVRHSGAPEGEDVVVRVRLWADSVRLEVEDPGRDGVIAPQPQDLLRAGGRGLHLVQTLSERWGLERVAAGGTRVWAQPPSAPLVALAPAEHSGVGGARSSPNGTPDNARAAAPRRRQPMKGSP